MGPIIGVRTRGAIEDDRVGVVELDGESLLVELQVVEHLDMREIVELTMGRTGMMVLDQRAGRPLQLHVAGARNPYR